MDVLHCHHLVMSLELAHRYGTAPIVYTNHTRYDLYAAVYSRLPQSVADWAMRRLWPRLTALADGVIAPSPGVATVMHAFGVRQPVRCIPNGIDLSAFDSVWPIDLGIDGTVALYVGRISAEKNLGVLLDQFSQACNAAPDLHLVLVGDGPLLGSLRARALASPVSDRVHFVGSVPFADVPRYLAAADLFVTASTSEVHPLTVIEALAAGLPVVGVHSPGLSDMVQPGENGVLVDSAENELADAIAALASDEPRRRALGAAASAASRQYDIRVTVQRTLQLYDELLVERTMLVAQR
jgi:glycosyltransferase involved in cell wall biosynthesis